MTNTIGDCTIVRVFSPCTGTATLPQIEPNRVRYKTATIKLLVANPFRWIVESASIILVTDLLYADLPMLKYSLAILLLILIFAGVTVVASGHHHIENSF